jgi:hypothetical protein
MEKQGVINEQTPSVDACTDEKQATVEDKEKHITKDLADVVQNCSKPKCCQGKCEK